MIHLLPKLIKEIESNSGFKIVNRKHCEILSELIFIKTGENINYNTIRRAFGISKGGSPSIKTLNVFSNYCGYSTYSEFISLYRTKNLWDINQYIYYISKNYPNQAIEKIEKSYNNVDEYLHMLISILREFALEKQFKLIRKCFSSTLTDPKKYKYSQILLFANCIGEIFKNEQLNILDFAELNNFKECYFKMYIDYSSLNSNYGRLLDFYNENSDDDEMQLFCNCLIQFRNYLNCKPLDSVKTKLKFEEIHPILYGRFMGIKVKTSENSEEVVSTFLEKTRENKNAIEYLYEFTFFNIVSRNFKLLEITKNHVSKHIIIPQYEEYHYSIFTLVAGIISLYKGIKCNEIVQELKEMTFFRNSKRDIIELFISILEYHNFFHNTQAYDNYKLKSKSLGYKRFDENYLLHFFNT